MKINHEKIVKSWGKDIPDDAVDRAINTAKMGLEFVKSRGLIILQSDPPSGASLNFSDDEGIVLNNTPSKSSRTLFLGKPEKCNFESIGFQLEQIFGACEERNRFIGYFQEGPIPLILGKEHRRSLAVLRVLARENKILITGEKIAELPQIR